MFTPLQQFDIYMISSLHVLDSGIIYWTNLTVVVFGLFIVFSVISYMLAEKIGLIPTKIQLNLLKTFSFVFFLNEEQIGKRGRILLPLIYTFFSTIILLNVMGLMPSGFAVTSHFVWSLFMSLSIGLGIFFLGLINYGLMYLKLFIMSIPLLLYPLMTLIEIASYGIKMISLGIRLSANIMAGHILVDIIGEVVAFLNLILIDLSVIVYGLLFFLFLLEMGIAGLQAYVFVLLCTLYLNDSMDLHLHG